MELTAVLLARSIALFDVAAVERAHVLMSRTGFVASLVERFSFMAFPTKLEDFDAEKGITFKMGHFENSVIDELVIYSDGVRIDTRTSTDDGKRIILESFEWLAELGLIKYTSDLPIRWAYLSQIIVHSPINLGTIHPAYELLSTDIGRYVNERMGENFKYRVNGFSSNFQNLNGNFSLAQFLLERRGKTLDSEQKYYSQAPLTTEQHLDVLSSFERNLEESNASRKRQIRRSTPEDAQAEA